MNSYENVLHHEHWFALLGFYALSDLRKKEMPELPEAVP